MKLTTFNIIVTDFEMSVKASKVLIARNEVAVSIEGTDMGTGETVRLSIRNANPKVQDLVPKEKGKNFNLTVTGYVERATYSPMSGIPLILFNGALFRVFDAAGLLVD